MITSFPHVIRQFEILRVGDLKVGQVFYVDFDNFVFFFSNNKRYVEKFEDGKAVVQCIYPKPEGGWGLSCKGLYELDTPAYVITGEQVSVW